MMPCHFEIRKDLGFLVTRFEGRVTDQEFLELCRHVLAEGSGFEPGLATVADLRPARFEVTPEALREVNRLTKARMAGFQGPHRTVIVAPTDVAYGLARLYGAITTPGPQVVLVFRELPEAAAALGLPPELLEETLRRPPGSP